MRTTETATLSMPIAGMTCQACALKLEQALRAVPGVAVAQVNFGARTATIEHDPALVGPEEICRAIEVAGYRTSAAGEASDLAAQVAFAGRTEAEELRRLRRDALLAVVLGALVLVALHLGLPPWIAIALTALDEIVAGGLVLRAGARALLARAPDMNTLVALGTLASLLAGAAAPLAPFLGQPSQYLHAAVMILAFVLLGRWLEGRARARAGGAVRALLDLAPPTARVLRQGQELEVPLSEVRPGNLVLVRPGERIPVDGTVLDGRSTLDETLLTGEGLPRECGPGERVHAGTLNGNGALSVQARGIGADTVLGRITTAVHEAQGTRPPIQRLADGISAVFVPAVLGLALLTLLAWWLAQREPALALARTIAVLVVACPCALGLATPTAVMAAVARAARAGCLLRGADTLERLARADVMALDKTGTLTASKPRLTRVLPLARTGKHELPEQELLVLAAALEARSEQPLGRAIHRAALERGLALPAPAAFLAEPGRGARGVVEGRKVWIGSPRAAAEDGLLAGSEHALLRRLDRPGESPVLLAVDQELAGLFALADPLRPEAGQAVRELRELGLEPELLSGDHPLVVAAIAQELGITRHRGGLSPRGKAEAVHDLQKHGHRVVMAGDGINDALALTVADVGLALGAGADVAIEAADGALLREDPRLLPGLVRLARRTMRTIRANLAWAFAYNLVALPLAAGALVPWTDWSIPPGWAGLAMATSSIMVVANSLRLARTRRF